MNLKLLAFYNLVLTGVLTILGLVDSNSTQETIYALSFAPMTLFFGFIVFDNTVKKKAQPAIAVPLSTKKAPSVPEEPILLREETRIADIDRRDFIRLIGVVGISFFLFSIFNKRSEASFFENAIGSGATSLKNSAGKKIDPAEKQPTDGYNISEIDDNDISYYGFTNQENAWYIMREEVTTGSIRYARGDSGFLENWANRKNIDYDYFGNVFRRT